MSLLRRRTMLQIKKASKTLQNPDDFLIFDGGTNYFNRNFYIEQNSANRKYTRRGLYSSVPTAKSCNLQDSDLSIAYPIQVPDNCTKIKSLICDVTGLQIIIFGAIWDGNDWSGSVAILNTGWILDSSNINLNGATHFMIMWRVDDNNQYFTDANTPTSVTIEFE